MNSRQTIVRLIVPLVLLALVVFLWVRGHRRADVVGLFTPGGKLHAVASHRGRVYFFASNLPFRDGRGMSVDADSTDARTFDDVVKLVESQLPSPRRLAGFEIGVSISGAFGTPGKSFGLLAVPHWFLSAICGFSPLRWAHLLRMSRRRAARGQCGGCGYDLRGNDAGRCPECGEPARPAAAAVVVVALAALLMTVALPSPVVAQLADLPLVKDLNLEDATLAQAFDRLRDASGANIVVDWPSLEAAGMDRNTPVSMRLWDVPLDVAIETILLRAGGKVADAKWVNDDGVITIYSGEGRDSLRTKVFDVRPLIRAMRRAGEEQRGQAPSWEEVELELSALIQDSVDPDTWRDAGGSLGALQLASGKLVVSQAPEALRQVEMLLVDQLAWLTDPPAPPEPPATRPAEPRRAPSDLETVTLRELDLADVPLDQAVERLRAQTHANIVVVWTAVESAGIERSTPITLRLRDVPLGRALDAVLAVAEGGTVKLAAEEDRGVITVSVAGSFKGGPARFYDVRDIVRALDAKRAKEPPHGGAAAKPGDGTEELILLMLQNVRPDSWREAGGSVGMVRSFFGRLIVAQTPGAHREIETMLAEMRRAITDGGEAKAPATSPPAPNPPALPRVAE